MRGVCSLKSIKSLPAACDTTTGCEIWRIRSFVPVEQWDLGRGIVFSKACRAVCVTIFVCFVQGNVKDFQLWVISKKDNVPYPLIGQFEENAALWSVPIEECIQHQTVRTPQGVLLSVPLSLRSRVSLQYPDESCDTDAVSGRRRQGRRCVACGQTGRPADGTATGVQAVPIHPEASSHRHAARTYRSVCFFFNPKKSDHESTSTVASTELPQKPLKRRRSFIAWAFWKGSSSHLNLSTTRGCLFSQPLSSVCIEDALPKPVMVSSYVKKLKKKELNLNWNLFILLFPARKGEFLFWLKCQINIDSSAPMRLTTVWIHEKTSAPTSVTADYSALSNECLRCPKIRFRLFILLWWSILCLSTGHARIPARWGLVDEGDLPPSSGRPGCQGTEGHSGQRQVSTSSNKRPRFCHRRRL